MSRKILFRADGTAETGLGHLYRLLALAEMLTDYFELVFVTRDNTQIAIIPPKYTLLTIPEEITVDSEASWLLSRFKPSEVNAVVLDGYQFNSSYQIKLKKAGYKLAYVDDFAKEHMYADIVINHAPQITQNEYRKEPDTTLALGTRFALLRPSFLEAAKKDRKFFAIENVYVSFGGADPNDLTYKTVKSLLKISAFKVIRVVVGASYKHTKLFDLAEENNRIDVHKNIAEETICKLLNKSHFAVVPSSTTLYEVCAIKMPVLSGYYVSNQKDIYKGMLRKNVMFDAGDFNKLTETKLIQKIEAILKLEDYSDYIKNQTQLFDSQISKRFLSLFLGVTYHRATENDLMLFYTWANDPVTRANSYVTDPIDLETHKNWFTNKLIQTDSLLFVARIADKAVGMVRFDMEEDHALIGISIDKDYRGIGLATRLLVDIQKTYFEEYQKPIVALIKQENIGSIKAFERAGFVQFSEKYINGFPSFEYRLLKP